MRLFITAIILLVSFTTFVDAQEYPTADEIDSWDIITFELEQTQVQTGDSFTVTWDIANVDSVCVDLLPYPLTQSYFFPICSEERAQLAQGSRTFTASDDNRSSYTVVLAVPGASYHWGDDFYSIRVDVDRVCEFDFMPAIMPYVENYIATEGHLPPCPDGPVQTVSAAYQNFERGYMFWFDDVIFVQDVFYEDILRRYVDEWDGENDSVSVANPEGLYIPERGFGNVWYEYYRVTGEWDNLVFATALEMGYEAQIQGYSAFLNFKGYPSIEDNGSFMISLPDNRIIFVETSSAGYVRAYKSQLIMPLDYETPETQALATPTAPEISSSSNVVCDNTPASRLSVGQTARVTISPPGENPIGLRVRDNPSGEHIATLEEGAIFEIIGEAVCDNGFIWWQISARDSTLTGWSAEGSLPDNYFIEPYNN